MGGTGGTGGWGLVRLLGMGGYSHLRLSAALTCFFFFTSCVGGVFTSRFFTSRFFTAGSTLSDASVMAAASAFTGEDFFACVHLCPISSNPPWKPKSQSVPNLPVPRAVGSARNAVKTHDEPTRGVQHARRSQ